MALQHLRSSTADKRPDPTAMADGQFAINTESNSPGVFFKDSAGGLVKVGPVHIGTTAPNAVPAGESGNSAGEFWLDTTGGDAELKLYDGSSWTTVGLPIAGGALTGDVTLNAQSDLRFADLDSSNWVAFQAPATIASNVTWTLPSADGTANQVLQTDGSGTLSWATLSASTDIISEGNTSAEVIDTGSDGRFVVTTDGTEALRVDNQQRLGLGTSSPASNLHVAGGSAPVVAQIGSTAGGETGAIIYHGTGTKYNWRIGAQQTADNAFEFARSTSVGGTTFDSPYLLINSSGNVGIGTTTPVSDALLTLSGSNQAIFFERAGSGQYDSAIDGSTGDIIFKNGSSSSTVAGLSERCRIDSLGRLLVGTSSAVTGGTAQYSRIVALGNSAGATNPGIVSVGIGTTPASGNYIGRVFFVDNAAGEYAEIAAVCDGTPGSGDYPGRLVFSTTADGASSPTERMRIKNDGQWYYFSSDTALVLGTSVGAGTTNALIDGRYSASGVNSGSRSFIVFTNGNVQNTNNSYGAISDLKLKENVVDATSQWDDIKALQVRNYNFKEETGHQTHTQIGLIAQEAELVSPGLVSETPDRETIQIPILDENGDAVLDENGDPTFTTEERETGEVTKSVNYSVLYMKAVKALQEAMERIESLEQRLNDAGIA